jgi:ribosomal protein L34
VAAYARIYQPAWRKRKIADNQGYLKREAAKLRRNVLLRALKRYDLTEPQYDALVAKGCGICGGSSNGRGRYAFDHDHATGKFRGLLCSKCNTALGLLNDDATLLGRAKQYLDVRKG